MSGGGGGNNSNYYANQDKLLGTQADILQNMYNAGVAPYMGTYAKNMSQQVDDANSGALTTRMRNQAGADASSALGQGIDATNRNMARYGIDPYKFAADSNATALGGAAIRSGAMNQATQWGEDQKWQRNTAALSGAMGSGFNTASGMGSAAGGYGQMAGQITQQNNANMAGYGAFGAGIARGFADGGEVHLASGGMPLVDWRSQATSSRPRGPGVGQALMAVAAPSVLKYGASEYLKPALKSAASSIKDAFNGSRAANTPTGSESYIDSGQMGGADVTGNNVSDAMNMNQGANAGVDATDSLGDAAPYGALAGFGAKLLAGQNAEQAAVNAVGSYGGAEAGAALGAPLGPVGVAAGGLIGSILGGNTSSLFANGGLARRRNMQPGGNVAGPGTATSDSIPARLSDGEYVLNAEAMKIPGVKAQVEAWNREGLSRRAKARRRRGKGGKGTRSMKGLG